MSRYQAHAWSSSILSLSEYDVLGRLAFPAPFKNNIDNIGYDMAHKN